MRERAGQRRLALMSEMLHAADVPLNKPGRVPKGLAAHKSPMGMYEWQIPR
jgi:hypothetical protein